MGKTFCMGDIHGGYKSLIQCLERSNFDKENDTLIQLGDVADGFPETDKCVDELLSIKNLISIKGNHDAWAHKWFETGIALVPWVQQGGDETIESYKGKHDKMNDHYEKFWRKQVNFYVDDNNRAFVHGGFSSSKGLGHDLDESNYYWDRDLWELALMQDRNRLPQERILNPTASNRFYKYSEVYLGHTSTTSWKAKGNVKESKDSNQILNGKITVPMNRCNVWNMDTGGGWGGKLTIMDIDSKEYFQSDFVNGIYLNIN